MPTQMSSATHLPSDHLEMPLKGLRHSRSGRELRRRSTFEPFNLAPPERTDPPARGTVSAEFTARDRPVDVLLVPADASLGSSSAADDGVSTFTRLESRMSRQSQESTWSRPFGFYKSRHASDSQLAAKARHQRGQHVPPVPALPHEREFHLESSLVCEYL
ncbi:MAG: hypothetical protein INR71_02775 [Terriglobus roseus]|nr:hypothetical protein [Terriglobus roseus]